VTGEPGLSQRPETDELDLPPASGARISGRVYDERGRPVPNATVRLAAGSSPSGKASYATTDRSGAFTLRGLRAGTNYTVIAEYDGQRGAMSGRMEAKAPDTNVRISMNSRSDDPAEAHSTIRPAKSRIEASVEDEDEIDNGNDHIGALSRAGRYNSEDLEPPAAEATSMLPRNSRSGSRVADADSFPPNRAGWNPQRRPVDDDSGSKVQNRASTEGARPKPSSVEPVEDDEDEGPNPLPPAMQSKRVGLTYPGDSGDDPPLKITPDRRPVSSPASRQTGSVALAPDDPRSSASGKRSLNRTPRPMPDGIVPSAGEARPDSFAPIRTADPSDSDSDTAPSRSSARTTRRGAAPSTKARPSRSSDTSGDDSEADRDRADNSASRARDSAVSQASAEVAISKRPTWRDVAINQDDVPVDESVKVAANVTTDATDTKPKAVTLTGATTASRTRRSLFQRLGGSKPPVEAPEASRSVCRLDPTERRLIDLQLPNLDGKIVSFHDLDADLVLLDFWGSWCKECRRSIPHLSDLQSKYGENRLRVVGIACERGSTQADRQSTAAKATRALKINYSVLVSTMDGSCPVQKGMQVHFYPTMVLLDRSGRIIQREQGATDATLARIDRAIATGLK
jgi:thiol-disulfide isomerase/thioredoxin